MFDGFILLLVILFAPIPWIITGIHFLVLKKSWEKWKCGVGSILLLMWAGLYFYRPITPSYYPFPPVIMGAGVIILSIAVTVELLTQNALGFWRVFGTSELQQNKEKLITTGIYRYVRHPRYIEHPLWFIGLGLLGYSSLLLFGIYLFLSFYVTAIVEEKELLQRYGQQYEEYKKKTPRFFL